MKFGKKQVRQVHQNEPAQYKSDIPVDWRTETLCLECIVPYGKWKGATLEEVMDDDPKYFIWLKENNLLGSWGLTKKKQVQQEKPKSYVDGFYTDNGEIWVVLREVPVVNPIVNNQIPF